MINSNLTSSPPEPRNSRGLVIFLLALAFIGFADATYLTVEHYVGTIPPCSIVKGCENVLTSGYSKLGPFPVSLAGALYYLVTFFCLLTFRDTNRKRYLHAAVFLIFGALLASLWFVYLQFFVLKAICIYCMGSALITMLLAIFTSLLLARERAVPLEE